jgi:hypothetical protein
MVLGKHFVPCEKTAKSGAAGTKKKLNSLLPRGVGGPGTSSKCLIKPRHAGVGGGSCLNPKFTSPGDVFLIGRGLAVARPDWSTNGEENFLGGKWQNSRGSQKSEFKQFPPKQVADSALREKRL